MQSRTASEVKFSLAIISSPTVCTIGARFNHTLNENRASWSFSEIVMKLQGCESSFLNGFKFSLSSKKIVEVLELQWIKFSSC